jgi:SAM-dependent methyltransferase
MKSLLEVPLVYLSLQTLIGAKKARRLCLEQFAKPVAGERVLDVGCGPGFVIDYLPKVNYVGTDLDKRYIDYALKHYGNRGNFHCVELNAQNIESFGKFDLILLNGVLHHIDDSGVSKLLMLLRSVLKDSGRLMTLDGCITESMASISRFLLRHDRGQFVRDESAYVKLASSVFPQIAHFHRTDLFSVPYDALVMVCRPLNANRGKSAPHEQT